MRILLVSALALGAFTSAALAEPVALNDAQMDSLTAGVSITISNSNSATVTQSNDTTIDVSAFFAEISVDNNNEANVDQSNNTEVTVD